MVESSKILTVSYGTFSCTLEGFEDSFSTMKAIAEYFRDLAAGDRYFGAEPPTPDAEMLTRIAEREIARRVEMRTSETGIVLRASDPAPRTELPPVRTAPAPAAVAEDAPVAEAEAPPVAETPAEETGPQVDDTVEAGTETEAAPVMPPAPRRPEARDAGRARAAAEDAEIAAPAPTPRPPRAEVPAHPDSESVAAKLQRIRAVVGGVNRTPAPANAFVEDLEDAAPAAAPAPVTAPEIVMPPVAEPADEAKTTEVATEQAAAIEADPHPSAEEAQDVTAGAGTPPSALSESETDAAIARAMAVFGGADAPEQPAGSADDDAVAKDEPTATAAAEEVDTAPAAASADGDAPDDTDDQINAVLRNLERVGLRTASRDATDAPEAAPEEVAQAPAAPRGRVLRVTRRPRPVDPAEVPESAPAPAEPQASAMAETPDRADTPEAPVAPAAPAAAEISTTSSVAAMIAAAQRAKREAAATAQPAAPQPAAPAPARQAPAPQARPVAQDDDADDMDDAPQMDGPSAAPVADDAPVAATFADSVAARDGAEDLGEFTAKPAKSTLSEEDEADLQRTLASLGADDMDEAPAAAPMPAADPAPVKSRRDPLPDTSEAEMSRIMSQANEELADPEASRRRNAIAHLKAAVAATEAARQLGEAAAAQDESENAFREDLDQVVRPRRAPRPEATGDSRDRPRPAPLKLVASQRIDLDEDRSTGPVQPRRVSTADRQVSDDAGNFAEFAESMGATSLQDLLEAAAAYTAYVEGSEDFSRPHIMQKVRQTVTEDFSREDGLRSFGTLLRQGRIERSRNGRFTVSDGNRFKPDAMAAGA